MPQQGLKSPSGGVLIVVWLCMLEFSSLYHSYPALATSETAF